LLYGLELALFDDCGDLEFDNLVLRVFATGSRASDGVAATADIDRVC